MILQRVDRLADARALAETFKVTVDYLLFDNAERRPLNAPSWVDFVNNERPHEALDDLTPVRAEELHYAARNQLTPTG